MSIYPVPLQEWFPFKKRMPEIYKLRHEIARQIVDLSRCSACNKRCKWNRAWGHHSVPWGYGDVWCSKKCVFGGK